MPETNEILAREALKLIHTGMKKREAIKMCLKQYRLNDWDEHIPIIGNIITRLKREGRAQKGNSAKGQKVRKPKREKWKYDAENTGGPYFFNSQEYPVGTDGEYEGRTIEEIRTRIGKLFADKKRAGGEPDYLAIMHQVLDELRYPAEKWKRRAILSALSREMWRRRKARATEVQRKKLEEAHEAEINHALPFEED